MDLFYQKSLVYLGVILASPLAGWAIGAVLPWLIAILQKPGQAKWLRALIMLAVCLVSSIAVVLHQQQIGVIPPDRLPILVIETIVSTFVMYKGLWEHLGVRRFESFTSDLAARVASAAGIVRGLEITFAMVKPSRQTEQTYQNAPCPTTDERIATPPPVPPLPADARIAPL